MAFDAVSATNAYIDSLGTEALAQAAAYTAGNHWLILWLPFGDCSLHLAYCSKRNISRALKQTLSERRV
jgi:hypothetical protein